MQYQNKNYEESPSYQFRFSVTRGLRAGECCLPGGEEAAGGPGMAQSSVGPPTDQTRTVTFFSIEIFFNFYEIFFLTKSGLKQRDDFRKII